MIAKGELFKIIAITFLLASLPISLILVKQKENSQSNAAAADKLEIEGGVLSGNATSQNDSNASGGSYVLFANQTSSSPTPTPTPPSSGITYTDYTYSSGSLQAFINNTPSGKDDTHWSRILVPSQTKITLPEDGRITINNKHHLTIYGCDPSVVNANGAVNISTPRARIMASGIGNAVNDSVFGIGNDSVVHHIEILCFEIVGSLTTGATQNAYQPGKESQMGITVWGPGGSHHIRIAYNYFHDLGGHSVYMRANPGAELSDISFDHNYILRMGTMGVAVVNGIHGVITDNFIIDTAYTPIDFENDAENALNELYDWKIIRNTIDRWGWPSDSANFAIVNHNHWGMKSTTRDILIDGNILRGGKQAPGSSFGSLIDWATCCGAPADPKQNIIIRNTDSTVSLPNIYIERADGVTITGNKMAGSVIANIKSTTSVNVSNNTPASFTQQ